MVVGGDDFTVRGGAADASIWAKQVIAEQMANQLRLPMVRLVDGTGGGGSVRSIEMDGRTYVPANPAWDWVVANMGTVPVIALALGSVAGLGAARAVTSHYSLMVEGISQVFVAGPPVVARVAAPVDKETLGGAEIHARNGAIDDVVASEDEAFERTRTFLSHLPSSVYDLPPRGVQADDPGRRDEALIDAVPRDRRKVYKMRRILETALDRGSFFEIGRLYGRSAITGLARLDGWPVAVLAGDPYHYGAGWTAEAAHKVTCFVDLAETFHLPVVHFVDNPGFVIGVEAEKSGDHPPWRPRVGRDLPGNGALVLDHRAQGLRRCRCGPCQRLAAPLPLRLALRRLGLAAGRGRHRGRLQGRSRRGGGPRSASDRDRSAPEPVAFALPHGGGAPDRGDHRSAGHPGRF